MNKIVTVFYNSPGANGKHLTSGMYRMALAELTDWIIAKSRVGVLIITEIKFND